MHLLGESNLTAQLSFDPARSAVLGMGYQTSVVCIKAGI